MQGPTVPRAVANLNAALRKAVHASTKTGTSAKGVYASATEEMYTGREGDRALRQESNAMWRNQQADMGAIRTVMKHRLGQFWNKATAFRRGAP